MLEIFMRLKNFLLQKLFLDFSLIVLESPISHYYPAKHLYKPGDMKIAIQHFNPVIKGASQIPSDFGKGFPKMKHC